MTELRQIARQMFDAAVSRANPALALREHLRTTPLPNTGGGRCFVIAVGKAAIPMMREALAFIPNVYRALVVTNAENYCKLDGAKVVIGSHPIPDARSAQAGQAVIDLLQETRKGDHVVTLISGGGSALMIAPVSGIDLDHFSQTNEQLLAGGLAINDINLIRQQIDVLKGGGLLQQAYPAKVYGYLLSDVIGDDMRAIASGPTLSPLGACEDAIRILQSAKLWEKIPTCVRDYLETKQTVPNFPLSVNWLIGSNSHSLEAMADVSPEGFETYIAKDALIGDVKIAAQKILHIIQNTKKPVAIIFGGETTVQLQGNGLGGRNQELALRVALGATHVLEPNWVFLSGGTDGRDGPTDAAGGIVDGGTLSRIASANTDIEKLLENNDSYHALKLAGDLLMTGSTGTNVADVQLFLFRPNQV